MLSIKTPVNILRMGALVGVLPLLFNKRVVVIMMMFMFMFMFMFMVMMVVVMIVRLALFPGSPCHPQGD